MDNNSAKVLANTCIFVLGSIALTIILDLFIAVMTTYFIKNNTWSTFFKSIIMIPMITPVVIYSVLWIWVLSANGDGLLNKTLLSLHFLRTPVNWIASYPFQVVIAAQVMVALAFGAIIFSSAIKSIPENLFRAARIDGARELSIVFSVILPSIKSHIRFIALWEILGLLTNYMNILLITDGGPLMATEVWSLSAYHKAFIDQKYGYGAALSLVLVLMVFIFLLVPFVIKNCKKPSRCGEASL